MSYPSTTSPDLVNMVARLFGLNQPTAPQHQIIHMPERRTPDRMTVARPVVTLPTQQDIEEPVTPEARAAFAIAAHAAAAAIERHAGTPASLHVGAHEARVILSAYLRTYRRVAERQDGGAA